MLASNSWLLPLRQARLPACQQTLCMMLAITMIVGMAQRDPLCLALHLPAVQTCGAGGLSGGAPRAPQTQGEQRLYGAVQACQTHATDESLHSQSQLSLILDIGMPDKTGPAHGKKIIFMTFVQLPEEWPHAHVLLDQPF